MTDLKAGDTERGRVHVKYMLTMESLNISRFIRASHVPNNKQNQIGRRPAHQ